MGSKRLRIVGIASLVGVALWGGLAWADGHASRIVRHLHHAVEAHERMGELITALGLNDAQYQHIENIHALMSDRLLRGDHAHGVHLAVLTTLIEDGRLSQDATRSLVDQHVDQLRHLGYQLGDELVALLGSLDEDQRAILATHLDHAAAHLQAGDL